MYILSKHRELLTQINIHEIAERCCNRNLAPKSKRFKPASIKRFGEDISQLIFCGNKHKGYFPGFEKVMNEMMPNVDVLGPRMLNWIL